MKQNKIYKCEITNYGLLYCTKIIKNNKNTKFCNIIKYDYEYKQSNLLNQNIIEQCIHTYYTYTNSYDMIDNYIRSQTKFIYYATMTNDIIETTNTYTFKELTKDNCIDSDKWVFINKDESILNASKKDEYDENKLKLVFFNLLHKYYTNQQFNNSLFRKLFYTKYGKEKWINNRFIPYNKKEDLSTEQLKLYNIIFGEN